MLLLPIFKQLAIQLFLILFLKQLLLILKQEVLLELTKQLKAGQVHTIFTITPTYVLSVHCAYDARYVNDGHAICGVLCDRDAPHDHDVPYGRDALIFHGVLYVHDVHDAHDVLFDHAVIYLRLHELNQAILHL